MNFRDNHENFLSIPNFSSLLNSGCSKLAPPLFSSKRRNQELHVHIHWMWNSRWHVIYFSFFLSLENFKRTPSWWEVRLMSPGTNIAARTGVKFGEGEVERSIWERQKKTYRIVSLYFEISLDSIHDIFELTSEIRFSLCFRGTMSTDKWDWHGFVLTCSIKTEFKTNTVGLENVRVFGVLAICSLCELIKYSS